MADIRFHLTPGLRPILWAASLLLIGVATPLRAASPSIELWTAKHEQTAKIISFDGEVEALHQATVAAQTSGRITDLNYDVGDLVPAGATIARLTSVEQAAQLAAAQSQVKEAQALLREAEVNFQRSENMLQKKLISQVDHDRAQANVQSIRAKAKAAEAAVLAARENLAYTAITAPYAGIVVERLVQPGETVQPGSPIMTGISLEALRVNVHIPQRHIGPVRQYQTAHILLQDQTLLQPSAMRIPPKADSQTHTFKVILELPENTPALFPGTLVKVQFVNGSETRLTVPTSALVKRGEVNAVYVSEQESLSLRYVRLGEAIGDKTAILAGLEEGDQVILNPIAAAQIYKEQHQLGDHQ